MLDQNHLTAQKATLKAFLNSFLRENPDLGVWDNLRQNIQWQVNGKSYITPVEYDSPLGHHLYTGVITNTLGESVSLEDFLGEFGKSFCEQVQSSYDHLQDMLAHHSKEIPQDLRSSEQGLLFGHPFHPYPKLREGIDLKQSREYSPEYGVEFPLIWVTVDNDTVESLGANRQTLVSLCRDDAQFEVAANETPFPMHPLQYQKLSITPWFGPLVKRRVYGKNKWWPSSSMRSLMGEGPCLKFSLSLKLTNSLRHLYLHEAKRGLDVISFLETEWGQKWKSDFPHFHVLAEYGVFMLKDHEESMVILRDRIEETQDTHLLATLVGDLPGEEIPQLTKMLQEKVAGDRDSYEKLATLWMESFLDRAVLPLLVGQANYGLLFGAHLQNIVLKLRDGFPESVYFKDCQGSGICQWASEYYAKNAAGFIPDERNVLEPLQVNKIVLYYLVVNTLFGVLHALGFKDKNLTQKLLQLLKTYIHKLTSQDLADDTALRFILSSPFLYSKENFRCSQEAINESTMKGPASLYKALGNPLHQGGTHVSAV